MQPSFLTAKITARPVTVSGITANNKTYNRSTAAALNMGSAALVDKVTGDSVNLITTGAAGAFSDWNVGTGKPVTITGVTITGTDAANYSLIQQTGVTANITPKGLTVSGIAANNKVYDRSTAAELNLVGAALVGKETGDTVNLDTSGAAGAFSDWNVGNSKPITVTGVTITGTNMANYSLTQPAGIKANITTKELTVSGVAANNKIYDGTTAATFSFASAQLAGVIGTDVVTLNSGSAAGTFDDKNVGTGKAVTISGLSLDGAEMGNYHLAQPAGLTADITPAVLTVTADNKTRLEGDANPPLTVTVTGFVNGELATDIISGEPVLSTTAVISSLKGDYDIVIENAGTLQAPNYTFNFVKGILTITRELRFKSYLPAITHTH